MKKRLFLTGPMGCGKITAIAQALGMVGARYDGTRTATRGELAVMLCRLLEGGRDSC